MTAIEIVRELSPFADEDGETFVQVQVEGADETEHIPVESPTGRMILRSIMAEHKGRGVPTDHEVRSLVEIAKGYAYSESSSTASKDRKKPW